MTRSDDGPPVQLVTIERREPGWMMVSLDGELVWKRLTRDPAFTRLWVCWPSNGTQNPQTRKTYSRVQLGGSWRPRTRGYDTINGGVVFDVPPMGERWDYRRLAQVPPSKQHPYPRPAGFVRDGLPRDPF